MLKGIQRQMVEMKTDKSKFFERAYFVLREGGTSGDDKKNIVDEANKIIEGVCAEPDTKEKRREKRKRRRRRILLFAFGFLCGAGAAVLSFVLTVYA